jgi:hypothetical protein
MHRPLFMYMYVKLTHSLQPNAIINLKIIVTELGPVVFVTIYYRNNDHLKYHKFYLHFLTLLSSEVPTCRSNNCNIKISVFCPQLVFMC